MVVEGDTAGDGALPDRALPLAEPPDVPAHDVERLARSLDADDTDRPTLVRVDLVEEVGRGRENAPDDLLRFVVVPASPDADYWLGGLPG